MVKELLTHVDRSMLVQPSSATTLTCCNLENWQALKSVAASTQITRLRKAPGIGLLEVPHHLSARLVDGSGPVQRLTTSRWRRSWCNGLGVKLLVLEFAWRAKHCPTLNLKDLLAYHIRNALPTQVLSCSLARNFPRLLQEWGMPNWLGWPRSHCRPHRSCAPRPLSAGEQSAHPPSSSAQNCPVFHPQACQSCRSSSPWSLAKVLRSFAPQRSRPEWWDCHCKEQVCLGHPNHIWSPSLGPRQHHHSHPADGAGTCHDQRQPTPSLHSTTGLPLTGSPSRGGFLSWQGSTPGFPCSTSGNCTACLCPPSHPWLKERK